VQLPVRALFAQLPAFGIRLGARILASTDSGFGDERKAPPAHAPSLAAIACALAPFPSPNHGADVDALLLFPAFAAQTLLHHIFEVLRRLAARLHNVFAVNLLHLPQWRQAEVSKGVPSMMIGLALMPKIFSLFDLLRLCKSVSRRTLHVAGNYTRHAFAMKVVMTCLRQRASVEALLPGSSGVLHCQLLLLWTRQCLKQEPFWRAGLMVLRALCQKVETPKTQEPLWMVQMAPSVAVPEDE
jgi:hypothetical protein